MIAIIDYDSGNLRSASKAVEKLGAEVTITREESVISSADKVILPGVGAFGDCMDKLGEYNLIETIKNVISSGKPFLGICVGLQLLFEKSEESPNTPGLGVLKGEVLRFKEGTEKVPHMGWNSVAFKGDTPLFKDIKDDESFYFVHSYYVKPSDDSIVKGETDYINHFTSVVQKDNLFACQFHPEKSQKAGLKLLENFIAL